MGQAVYSVPFLRIWYDVWVLGVNNHLVWRCPTRDLVDHYTLHISGNHLEVGVGSGYLLSRCSFPTPWPRLVLLDSNEACLAAAGLRLASYRPECVRRNVLEPVSFRGELFDSIGFNYVLHCLPGSIPQKAAALDHLRALLRPGGAFFGSTLLAGGVSRGFLARRHMGLFNRLGIFSNASDTLAELGRALEERFSEVSLRTVGCAALFSARGG
jgi:hypothetical protein